MLCFVVFAYLIMVFFILLYLQLREIDDISLLITLENCAG